MVAAVFVECALSTLRLNVLSVRAGPHQLVSVNSQSLHIPTAVWYFGKRYWEAGSPVYVLVSPGRLCLPDSCSHPEAQCIAQWITNIRQKISTLQIINGSEASRWLSGKESTYQCSRLETCVWFLGQEDPLLKGMAIQPSNSSLGNPMDRGAWWATVHGVSKNRTWLSAHTHAMFPNVYYSPAYFKIYIAHTKHWNRFF